LAKIIAIANQKGGVGKTTTTVNLSSALAKLGKKVLICDFDPQGHSTSGVGVDKSVSPNIYDVIISGTEPKLAIHKAKNIDIFPTGKNLAGATIELVAIPEREYVLKKALDSVRENYDYIFIDCPPSRELLTLNALVAADAVIVPMQCEYFSLEGLSDLVSTVRIVKRAFNPNLDIIGIVLTMYDSRTNLSMQVSNEIKRHFPGKVFATPIPRSVRLSEAPSHGLSIFDYDPRSKGAAAYMSLAQEFLKKEANKYGIK